MIDDDMTEDEQNIIERIREAMEDDIENFDKQSALLLDYYDEADETGRKLVDNILICLCGWSLKTLRENAHKTDA